jgi:hypothetical protein
MMRESFGGEGNGGGRFLAIERCTHLSYEVSPHVSHLGVLGDESFTLNLGYGYSEVIGFTGMWDGIP